MPDGGQTSYELDLHVHFNTRAWQCWHQSRGRIAPSPRCSVVLAAPSFSSAQSYSPDRSSLSSCSQHSWQASMSLDRTSSVLPVHSDLRTHSRSGYRLCPSSKRVRYAVAIVFLLVVTLFFLVPPPGPPHSRPPIFDDDLYDDPRVPGRMPPPGRPPPKGMVPPPKPASTHSELWRTRAEKVKEAFVRGYSAYYSIAFPHDELLPKTNGSSDRYVKSSLDALHP